MTKARDYGIVSLAVDGSQLGQSFDGYNFPNVTVATVDYGPVPLSAGAHQLTFTLVGKNASSLNYLVGIDYLLLTKTNSGWIPRYLLAWPGACNQLRSHR